MGFNWFRCLDDQDYRWNQDGVEKVTLDLILPNWTIMVDSKHKTLSLPTHEFNENL